MDRAQRELAHGYLTKARDKARVARELFGKDHWEDAGASSSPTSPSSG